MKEGPQVPGTENSPQALSPFLGLTRQDEEDARNEGQNGPLWADVADVTDDEGREH